MRFDLLPGIALENTAGKVRLLYSLGQKLIKLPVAANELRALYGFLGAAAASQTEEIRVSVTGRLRLYRSERTIRSTISGADTVQEHPATRVDIKRARAKLQPYL